MEKEKSAAALFAGEKLCYKPTQAAMKLSRRKSHRPTGSEGITRNSSTRPNRAGSGARCGGGCRAAGFRAFDRKAPLKAGDKVYYSNRGKSLVLAVIGSRPITDGIRSRRRISILRGWISNPTPEGDHNSRILTPTITAGSKIPVDGAAAGAARRDRPPGRFGGERLHR